MIGSLFSGTGALDMAVEAVFGEKPAWFVEYEEAPSKILAHHWPGVPNYGDVTTIDWASVPPVSIVTAGYPCQPFSTAGKRKGSNDVRHLWPYVLEAIRYLRPRFVVLENVRGHLTLGFDRVLLDLAEAGYDADWICIPASDAGAPHKRERLFVVAHPANDGHEWSGASWDRWEGFADDGLPSSDTDDAADDWERSRTESGQGGSSATDAFRERSERRRGASDMADPARDGSGEGDQWQRDGDAADDCGAAAADAAGARRSRREDAGAGRSDASEIGGGSVEPERARRERTDWGDYAAAIARWESVIGRDAPAPAVHGRLAPEFVEWMMGLPAGHVSDIDIPRSKQLKALGNGVVPQQAALALRILLGTTSHHLRQGESE